MRSNARILIVDDEPNVRLVFRTALEESGYLIAEAADGASALEALGQDAYDLLLLDLLMPNLDGLEVLRRLSDDGHLVPTVIVTAHGTVPDAVRAMKLGAIDFVSKPITPDGLRDVVSEVLHRHAPGPAKLAEPSAPVTAESEFAEKMMRAKRALNARRFDEAEVLLKEATALRPNSAEAHNLMGVLCEVCNRHDVSYREYRAALKADKHYTPAMHNMRRYYERYTFGSSEEPVDLGESEE